MQGLRAAHSAIVANYLDATDCTYWIHFTDIGNWNGNDLNRSSIAEFLQCGNDASAAAYYQTFDDVTGAPLDGSQHGYEITFPANDLPEASRFWSITEYTPGSVTLVPNPQKKWVVGSYTPGLVTNPDGSLTLYFSTVRPPGTAPANWLPARQGKFNLMLRVYGPEGSVADNTYTPPAVMPIP